ncbi:hypothetical protein M8J75_000359 [Diaphorina citri]|nr:hypothetical protein M8J75_000359 [Diaphorina citri]
MSSSEDLVAIWEVPLNTGVHTIEFEHGTATGKRVIRVNGKELLRRDWMFRLVGEESFQLDSKVPCLIKIEPSGPFGYAYSITVDGKTLEKFSQAQSKANCTWIVTVEDETYRVVLERGTLDIWVNGDRVDVTGEFVENGTETHFTIGDTPAYIKAVSSCNKKEGLLYSLIVNDNVVPPSHL